VSASPVDSAAVDLIAKHLRLLNPGLAFDELGTARRILAFAARSGIATDQVIQFLYEAGAGVTLWDARDVMGTEASAEHLRMDVYGVSP
jgi:hypothetical protein